LCRWTAYNLCVTYEVSSFAKPGARMSVTTDTERKDWKAEQWGCCGSGANDTSNNNSKEAMKHICNCVEKRRKTNIVIRNVCHRHDLMPSSCVNSEVIKFNRQPKIRKYTIM